MKRKGFLFEDLVSLKHMYDAFRRAFRGAGRTGEACRFHFHLERELLALMKELKTGTYRPARYRYFKIFDPKERTISVAAFRDRVVHHALVGVLEPFLDPGFIYDSYATRKGKGTHSAIRRAQGWLKKNYWYLKIDVNKYFDSVDHEILSNLIRKKVKDGKVLDLVRVILRNSDHSRGLAHGKGLPIGNMTSQFFANVYLDALDHFVKDRMGVRYYLRYMDDMVFFSGSRKYLKNVLKEVEAFLDGRLGLSLNPGATFLNSRMNGLPFLGFRVFPDLIRVKKENLKRIKKKLEQKRREFETGLITEECFVMSARSMFDHIGFANSLILRNRVLLAKETPRSQPPAWERILV